MLSRYNQRVQTATLDLPRSGGLRVTADSAEMYQKLIPLIQRRAVDRMIYAAPDCPEVYFLAGYKNPTSILTLSTRDDSIVAAQHRPRAARLACPDSNQ
jgi:hypothetical protein